MVENTSIVGIQDRGDLSLQVKKDKEKFDMHVNKLRKSTKELEGLNNYQ